MRPKVTSQFAMSTELECLTVFDREPDPQRVMGRFFDIMKSLAPTLPALSGIFNGYGRIYIDCGHLELAICECDSPYLLPLIVERQQRLVQKAIVQLEQEGCKLLLANNNHSGLLQGNCPIWGSHENYLSEVHPAHFGDLLLPFLSTRIYAGAGGIEYPSGNYLAAVRPVRMELETGGDTTRRRAIHSTSREEHHMGPAPDGFRYHLILGDGHRSHFNLALQFGATALALKAIQYDNKLRGQVPKISQKLKEGSWVHTLKRFNVLCRRGEPIRVDPAVIETQQMYLAAARRYANSLKKAPEWIERVLRDWQETLAALDRLDLDWLSARLDTFAKFAFYSAVLRQEGVAWSDLPQRLPLFTELALLDHSYHAFCCPRSVFNRLEAAGLLQHRVGPQVEPGEEQEPFVPETETRARTRARFIREHAGASFIVDWSWILCKKTRSCQSLYDVFAQNMEPASVLL